MRKYFLKRDVSREEVPWMTRDLQKGEIVYECVKATYGCISHTGVACTNDENGNYPFFELPADALSLLQ